MHQLQDYDGVICENINQWSKIIYIAARKKFHLNVHTFWKTPVLAYRSHRRTLGGGEDKLFGFTTYAMYCKETFGLYDAYWEFSEPCYKAGSPYWLIPDIYCEKSIMPNILPYEKFLKRLKAQCKIKIKTIEKKLWEKND